MAKVQIFANSIITENFENAELESEIFKELKILKVAVAEASVT